MSSTTKRAIVLVLDSVGIGAMPDAASYNDPPGCNTIANVAKTCGGLNVPSLQQMGLGNIAPIDGVPAIETPTAAFGRMAEKAPGKDTTTGHWEMTGALLQTPLALFPDGFPDDIIQEFVTRTGRDVLGNISASGTQIIAELGEQQRESGKWIVYTSADSVFQIAAHEEVIPLDELYKACEIARELLTPHHVGRVIARPYVGTPGDYTRTANRKDYALDPPAETVLERLQAADVPVYGIGKIANIFNDRGIYHSTKTKDNHQGMEETIAWVQSEKPGFLFVNLVDFDSKFGHRNNPKGYGAALEAFDEQLTTLLPLLKQDDLLMITADHGCDPTVPGTDHSREYVPILTQHSSIQAGTPLETRSTFADVAQTLATFFALDPMPHGQDFFSTQNRAN